VIETRTEQLEGVAATRYVLNVPFHRVLNGWRSDPDFCQFFCDLLRDCPYEAYTFETPSVCGRTVDRTFEFVLAKSRRLTKLSPSFGPFASHLEQREESVVRFPNLGGDATFVVPCPVSSDHSVYRHLGAFMKGASEEQKHTLCKEIAHAVDERISVKQLWVSTSKVGVPWLHCRIDSTPKHYRHQGYLATDS